MSSVPGQGGSSRCSHKEKKGYIAGKRKVLGMVQKCCSSCSLNECYTEGRKKYSLRHGTRWSTFIGNPKAVSKMVLPNTKCLVFLLKMQILHAPAIHIWFLQIYCKGLKSIVTKFLNTQGPSCYGHVLFFFSSVEFDPFIHSSNFYCLLYTRQEVRYWESSKTRQHQVLCLWAYLKGRLETFSTNWDNNSKSIWD